MSLRRAVWKLLWPLRARRHRGLAEGSVFPDFQLEDVHGRRHALSRNPESKLTVLWFTNFCEDCRSRIPLLEELLERAADRYRVLAVSILDSRDPLPRQVASTCPFPVLLDPEDVVSRRLGLAHPPGTCPLHNLFIVDPLGRIVYRRHLSALGPETFRAAWRGWLEPGQQAREAR